MASILRQIVAGPRSRHPEAGLDLCYVTDNIIVTSGPSSTYPQRAYRNPTDALVKFLDYKHGANWSIWEFRAEGTGYPDTEVYGRIRHYPWPDHHPPPFSLIPNIMASMRNWLKDPEKPGRVAVVHCKAGKGRSGTITCSYLISEEGWKQEDALARFTERRMRVGFGNGVSIPSQLRWVGYVDRWNKTGKVYVERQVEILEVHVWGLRDGVKVGVEGFVDEGRTIKTFHTFNKSERLIIDGETPQDSLFTYLMSMSSTTTEPDTADTAETSGREGPKLISAKDINRTDTDPTNSEAGGKAVIFRPAERIVLPTSDVCIDFERRNRATYGWTMVTSVAHVWFNVFFEGLGNVPSPIPNTSSAPAPESASTGIFEIQWDAMDGIKGSSRKGTRALDRLAVVWRALDGRTEGESKVITEPKPGEPVPETRAADWAHAHEKTAAPSKDLGLRVESPVGGASKASSVKSTRDNDATEEDDDDDDVKGVQVHGPDGETHIPDDAEKYDGAHGGNGQDKNKDTSIKDVGLGTTLGIVQGMKHVKTEDLPAGKPQDELKTSSESRLGQLSKAHEPE